MHPVLFLRSPMRVSLLFALIAMTSITLSSTSYSFAAAIQESESAATPTSPIDGASTWIVDNEHTSVVCAASHFGLSFIYGRFNKCSGTIQMDFQEPSSSSFRFEIDPDSIDTNNASRDISLRGPSCLDARQYKTISFESTSVKAEDKPASTGRTKRTFQVTGNLTMHGETRQIKIPLELLAVGNGPEGKLRCGFMSRFVVNRSNFGLDKMKDSVGDSIAVTFCLQAVQQEAKPETEVEVKTETDDEKEPMTEREKMERLFRSDDEITDEKQDKDN